VKYFPAKIKTATPYQTPRDYLLSWEWPNSRLLAKVRVNLAKFI
jgi:hypothetical protein